LDCALSWSAPAPKVASAHTDSIMPGNALQQKRSQVQTTPNKGAVRTAQNTADSVQAFAVDLTEVRPYVADKEVADQTNGNAHDSTGSKVEASETTTKAPVEVCSSINAYVDQEVKVQCDQLLRETADDSEMLEEFICKICQVHVVGCEPKLARCSHLFCGDCIAKWFEVHPRGLNWAQRARAKGLVPCPVCKEPLHQERDLFRVCATGQNENALLWRLLSGVKIVCANNPKCRANGKCTWIGEYGSYQKHLQTCQNVPLDNVADASPGMSSNHALPATEEASSQNDSKDTRQVDGVSESDRADSSRALSGAVQSVGTGTDVASQPLQQAGSALRTIRSFIASGSSQLSINKGELIQVSSQHPSGWTYGRKVREAAQVKQEEQPAGWFPNWAIA